MGNLNGTGTSWVNGYQAPSGINQIISNDLCPNNNPPTFINKTLGSGLSQGTFFIIVEASNTKNASQAISQTEVNLRYQVSTRTQAQTAWSAAVDLNNQSMSISGGTPTLRVMDK